MTQFSNIHTVTG